MDKNNHKINKLDITQIKKLLSQRYPFLMIDRIIQIDPGNRAIAIKNLSANESYFQGHFPELPIMPGVLILDAIAQTAIVLFKYKNKLTNMVNKEILLGSVKGRFLNSAYPGDQMIIEVVSVKFISTGAVIKGVCRVEDKVICKAEISFSVKDLS